MKIHLPAALLLACLTLILTSGSGCKSIYYGTWERLGYEKRDLLVDQVKDTRAQQEETKQQFASALEQFQATFDFDGGELEKAYEKLKDDYDRSVSQADDLRGEIKSVKSIGKDLFKEWGQEIELQANPEFKDLMVQQRDTTRASYDQMVEKMDTAAARMDPVLQAFNDRILVMKSSLNAAAIASLETTSAQLAGDVEALIAEMNQSIAEADEFISALSAG
ncbi:MAG: DUF2959 family protein [Planctomycetota bacterium]